MYYKSSFILLLISHNYTTFLTSIAKVKGPTPPGTGVIN